MMTRDRLSPNEGTQLIITQTSSRTVRIETAGGGFSLPYRLYWDGHDREPESIVLDGGEVRAFFLFGTIKDRISEDAHGVRIERAWSLMIPGTLRLNIEVDFDPIDGGFSWLFPGVSTVSGDPTRAVSFHGEKTSLPAALFTFSSETGVLLFADLPREGQEASVGVRRIQGEEGHLFAAELRFPPVEAPLSIVGPKPGHMEEPVCLDITSEGKLERACALNAVFAPRGRIVAEGVRAACARFELQGGQRGGEGIWDPKRAVASCMETHLYEKGGIMGLKELPESPRLSAAAGLSLSVLLQKLFPADARLQETSLRLADFCLKGQHPSGLFFESFDVTSGEWQGAPGKITQAGGARRFLGNHAGRRPLLSISQCARIADLLLSLSRVLSAKGLPGEKYFLAAARFVDFFFDEKGRLSPPGALHAPGVLEPAERGLAGFEFLFPLSGVWEETGRDKYKKAFETLAAEFTALPWDPAAPPSSREGRDPDSAAALLCGRLAALIAQKGRPAPDAGVFLSLLAPWVHLNRAPGAKAADTLGGIADSFRRRRLLFAGAETAYMLASLGTLAKDGRDREAARRLALLALDFTRQAPAGTAFFQHTRWDPTGRIPDGARGVLGPVDSRRLTREAEFAVRLSEEYPAFLKARVSRKPGVKTKKTAARVRVPRKAVTKF